VLIIDDVISAGTSVRESVEIIRQAGATPAAVVIALDRQERGEGVLSAVQEVEQSYGLSVLSIARLTDLIHYLSGQPELTQYFSAVSDYRLRYGSELIFPQGDRNASAFCFVNDNHLLMGSWRGCPHRPEFFVVMMPKAAKSCADFVPPECANRAYEERDGQGRIVKKYNAPLTAEQQALRTVELAKADAEKRKALEEQRQSAALLANYANEKEIDSARDRALAAIEKNLQQSRSKLDEANKAKKKLDGEKASYKNQPLPAQIKSLIRDNEPPAADRDRGSSGSRAHLPCCAWERVSSLSGIVEPRLLHHLAAALDEFDLAFDFEFDRAFDEAERVQVLDLGARAEGFAGRAGAPTRWRRSGTSLPACCRRRCRDNAPGDESRACRPAASAALRISGSDTISSKRRAGTVQVDAARAMEVLVQRLAGVFFEMRARDVDGPWFDPSTSMAILPNATIGRFVLADLIALGQIGIEIILAREHRARRDAWRRWRGRSAPPWQWPVR
jgi:hypothetical protein